MPWAYCCLLAEKCTSRCNSRSLIAHERIKVTRFATISCTFSIFGRFIRRVRLIKKCKSALRTHEQEKNTLVSLTCAKDLYLCSRIRTEDLRPADIWSNCANCISTKCALAVTYCNISAFNMPLRFGLVAAVPFTMVIFLNTLALNKGGYSLQILCSLFAAHSAILLYQCAECNATYTEPLLQPFGCSKGVFLLRVVLLCFCT